MEYTTLDSTTAHWLALGLVAVFQGVTVWAVVATRGKLAELKASIPPDLSSKHAKLEEQVADTQRRIGNAEKALKYAGEALITAARRLGAN